MSAEESKLIVLVFSCVPVGVKVSGIKSQSIEEQDNQKKGVWTAKQQMQEKNLCNASKRKTPDDDATDECSITRFNGPDRTICQNVSSHTSYRW